MISTEKPHKYIIIAALGANRSLGLNNKLPWHLPSDLKFFKQQTMGCSLLMGRKTHDSILNILNKPLPGRHHFVVSHSLINSDHHQITYVPKPLATHSEMTQNIYIIGGASLYKAWLPYADEMILTHIHEDFEADVFFPEFPLDNWSHYEINSGTDGDLRWTRIHYHAKTPLKFNE